VNHGPSSVTGLLPASDGAGAPLVLDAIRVCGWRRSARRGTLMIFGIPITNTLILTLGLTLYTLLIFQTLVGLRKIKFGRKTWVYHRYIAYVIIGIATLHGFLAILFAYGLSVF
jgi:hypothetical protein